MEGNFKTWYKMIVMLKETDAGSHNKEIPATNIKKVLILC